VHVVIVNSVSQHLPIAKPPGFDRSRQPSRRSWRVWFTRHGYPQTGQRCEIRHSENLPLVRVSSLVQPRHVAVEALGSPLGYHGRTSVLCFVFKLAMLLRDPPMPPVCSRSFKQHFIKVLHLPYMDARVVKKRRTALGEFLCHITNQAHPRTACPDCR